MRTLLQIVQAAANEMGLPTVATVVGNPDQQITQMLALANREGLELAAIEGGWAVQRGEQLITLVAGTDNYAFPSDFAYYVQDAFWDRTTKWPLAGPLNAVDWQLLKAGLFPGGINARYRIMGGRIYFDPVPTAADTIAIEYISANWCQSAAAVKQALWVADTDTPLIADDLFTLGVKWRFKREKGFDYGEDMATYQKALDRIHPRDKVTQNIYMRGPANFAPLVNLGPLPTITAT